MSIHKIEFFSGITEASWLNFKAEVQLIFSIMPDDIELYQYPRGEKIQSADQLFWLRKDNRDAEEDVEYLQFATNSADYPRTSDFLTGSRYCGIKEVKIDTKGAPYDFFVRCCMLLLHRNSPGSYLFESESDGEQFLSIARYLATVFKEPVKVPLSLHNASSPLVGQPLSVQYFSQQSQAIIDAYHLNLKAPSETAVKAARARLSELINVPESETFYF